VHPSVHVCYLNNGLLLSTVTLFFKDFELKPLIEDKRADFGGPEGAAGGGGAGGPFFRPGGGGGGGAALDTGGVGGGAAGTDFAVGVDGINKLEEELPEKLDEEVLRLGACAKGTTLGIFFFLNWDVSMGAEVIFATRHFLTKANISFSLELYGFL